MDERQLFKIKSACEKLLNDSCDFNPGITYEDASDIINDYVRRYKNAKAGVEEAADRLGGKLQITEDTETLIYIAKAILRFKKNDVAKRIRSLKKNIEVEEQKLRYLKSLNINDKRIKK